MQKSKIKITIKNLKILTLSISKKSFFSILIFTFYIFITPVSAQWSNAGTTAQQRTRTTDIESALKLQNFFQTDIGIFLSRGLEAAIAVGALACLGFFLWGGLSWLTSGGDKAKYEAARDKITHALVGLVLVLVTWALWQLLLQFFGLDLIFKN
jgi:hypothetical protein